MPNVPGAALVGPSRATLCYEFAGRDDLLTEGRATGTVIVDNVADAVLGALLLAVLGRSTPGADPPGQRFCQHLTEQVLRGVLTPRESS